MVEGRSGHRGLRGFILFLTLTSGTWAHAHQPVCDDPPGGYDDDPYRTWHRIHRKPTPEEEKNQTAWEYYRFGQSLAQSGWLSKALKPLERAVAFDTENGQFYLTLAMVLLDLGREEEAIQHLRSAYKFGDKSAKAQAAYEMAYLGEIIPAGQTTTREQKQEEARENLNDSIAWRHYHYGRTLAQEGWLSRSLGPLGKSIEINPKTGRFYLTRALVHLDLGNREKGVDDLLSAYMHGTDWVRAEAAYNMAALGEPIPVEPKTEAPAMQPKASMSSRNSGRGRVGSVQSLGSPVIQGRLNLEDDREAAVRGIPSQRSQRSQKNASSSADSNSLYTRLGGDSAIRAVVKEFLDRVGRDSKINQRFAGTNLVNLEKRLVEQIGQATGGPEVYQGSPMKAVHRGMGIRGVEFDAIVEDLVGALNRFDVPSKEQNELLSVLAGMREDIVEEN